MEIKHEAGFGDQAMFDRNDAPDDCEIIGDCCYKVTNGDVKVWNFSEKKWCKHYKKSFLCLAMRRIIRTPTWTVADQKAGKLPAVGCVVMVSPNCTATVTAVDNIQKVVSVQCENQALDILAIHEMLPIESPEGKAARLRDEWVERAVGLTPVYEIAAHGYSTQLRIDISSIYDAMISGDLPVLSKGV